MNREVASFVSELYKLTEDGLIFTKSLGEISVERRKIGSIYFPTGKLVVCDPHIVLDTDMPFSKRIPRGNHSVILCIANIETSQASVNSGSIESLTDIELLARDLADVVMGKDHDQDIFKYQLVAASLLEITNEEPVHWVVASVSENNNEKQEANRIFRYQVDSGTGSFMDTESRMKLKKLFKEDQMYHNYLDDLMAVNSTGNCSWAIPIIDQASGLNCAIFTSGEGDGDYASYWGYDSDGRLACLITDFGLLLNE